MSRITCIPYLSIFLFLLSPAVPASAMPTAVPVIFSLCTDLSSTEVARFIDAVNEQLSVSQLSTVRACGDDTLLYSSKGMLSVHLIEDEEKLYLEVQPFHSSGDGQNSTKRRREISWTATPTNFIEETKAQGKLITFALLLDNMVLDYAGIRLSPGQSDDMEQNSDAGGMSNEAVMPLINDNNLDFPSAQMPGADSRDDLSSSKRVEVTDKGAEVSVTKTDDEICEQRLAHLEMTFDEKELTEQNCQKKYGQLGRWHEKLTLYTGISAGVDMFTAGNWAPQLAMTVSLRRPSLVW